MKDLRPILLKALVPALKTATGKDVFSRIPKSKSVTYPYVYISEMYQEEIGSKTSYRYNIDTLIQVIYKDAPGLGNLYTDTDNILGLVNNGSPFALESPYKIESCMLNSTNTTEILTETGIINVGLIRLFFLIE
ncbi:MAG: hypothetical protein GWP06_02220 [Actinobacteria bacterium]|nr:hypothetical protein [Actinomycetota bacterium]